MKRKLETIATITTPYKDKFGIPRQSLMVDEVFSQIVFEKKFRTPTAIKGIEGFSHLWILWGFSEFEDAPWSPTVRPPRLGGNKRMGVFATRSPNRPNSIALSSVKLISVDYDSPTSPILTVSGADMLSGSPIYDIKPYIPFTDSHPDATVGFTEPYANYKLEVKFDCNTDNIEDKTLKAIKEILSLDPRPSYQNDDDRIYGARLFDYEVKFKVSNSLVTVISIEKE